jgi:hypothetical protein
MVAVRLGLGRDSVGLREFKTLGGHAGDYESTKWECQGLRRTISREIEVFLMIRHEEIPIAKPNFADRLR